MTTPNTNGPSDEAERAFALETMNDMGRVSRIPDKFAILSAALSRAREDARREALEEAAHAALLTGRMATDGIVRFGRYEEGYSRARADVVDAILALNPTPQGETKEQQP